MLKQRKINEIQIQTFKNKTNGCIFTKYENIVSKNFAQFGEIPRLIMYALATAQHYNKMHNRLAFITKSAT